mmetsp:Transcript_13737/g.28014  ORF Transcript_13737/g.28014 Transcript_13737/m.28014 type:complete len:84 (-) Transcript_13737:114-365(-)
MLRDQTVNPVIVDIATIMIVQEACRHHVAEKIGDLRMTTSTEGKGVQIAVAIQGGDDVTAIDMDDSSYQLYRGCGRFHWTVDY